jgi:hypothetical protein
MDLRETGREGVNWIELTRYRVQCRALGNAVMNIRFLE